GPEAGAPGTYRRRWHGRRTRGHEAIAHLRQRSLETFREIGGVAPRVPFSPNAKGWRAAIPRGAGALARTRGRQPGALRANAGAAHRARGHRLDRAVNTSANATKTVGADRGVLFGRLAAMSRARRQPPVGVEASASHHTLQEREPDQAIGRKLSDAARHIHEPTGSVALRKRTDFTGGLALPAQLAVSGCATPRVNAGSLTGAARGVFPLVAVR